MVVFGISHLINGETYEELKSRVTELELAYGLIWYGWASIVVMHTILGIYFTGKEWEKCNKWTWVPFNLQLFSLSCYVFAVRHGREMEYMYNLDPEKYEPFCGHLSWMATLVMIEYVFVLIRICLYFSLGTFAVCCLGKSLDDLIDKKEKEKDDEQLKVDNMTYEEFIATYREIRFATMT